MDLCQFFNDEFYVVMVNTTWEFHSGSKANVSKLINDNLVYLPNIAHLTPNELIKLGKTLTKYCESLPSSGAKIKRV